MELGRGDRGGGKTLNIAGLDIFQSLSYRDSETFEGTRKAFSSVEIWMLKFGHYAQ